MGEGEGGRAHVQRGSRTQLLDERPWGSAGASGGCFKPLLAALRARERVLRHLGGTLSTRIT